MKGVYSSTVNTRPSTDMTLISGNRRVSPLICMTRNATRFTEQDMISYVHGTIDRLAYVQHYNPQSTGFNTTSTDFIISIIDCSSPSPLIRSQSAEQVRLIWICRVSAPRWREKKRKLTTADLVTQFSTGLTESIVTLLVCSILNHCPQSPPNHFFESPAVDLVDGHDMYKQPSQSGCPVHHLLIHCFGPGLRRSREC